MIPIEEQVTIFAQRLAPILRDHEMVPVPHELAVQFFGPRHRISISYDERDQRFSCHLQAYELEAILTPEERDAMEEMRTRGVNFYRQADVLAKYIRLAWGRMVTPSNVILVSLRVAVEYLEPKLGPLPASRKILDCQVAGEPVPRELIELALDEATTHLVNNLKADSEPTPLGKEIDDRLIGPLAMLLIATE